MEEGKKVTIYGMLCSGEVFTPETFHNTTLIEMTAVMLTVKEAAWQIIYETDDCIILRTEFVTPTICVLQVGK